MNASEPSNIPPSGRRAAERHEVVWSVDCETHDTFLYACITNISALGIFVLTKSPLPPGTELVLRFRPPECKPFVLRGVVQWINPLRADGANPNPGMGIRFVDLTEHQREQLVEVIKTIAYVREPRSAPGN